MTLKVSLVILGALLAGMVAVVVSIMRAVGKDQFICPRCKKSRSEFEGHIVHGRPGQPGVRVCTSCLGAEHESMVALNKEAEKIQHEARKR